MRTNFTYDKKFPVKFKSKTSEDLSSFRILFPMEKQKCVVSAITLNSETIMAKALMKFQ